jgi:hypothetical protein
MSIVFDTYRSVFSEESTHTLDYEWDVWRDTEYFYFDDDLYGARFQSMSDYANLGLTIAICEWCCARFPSQPAVRRALEFLEVAWLAMINKDLCASVILDDDELQGPTTGPLHFCMLIVNDAIFDADEDGDYASRAGWARHLAEHIMPPQTRNMFREWLASSVQRMEKDHPYHRSYSDIFQSEFDRGSAVSPNAFIHNWNYDKSDDPAFLEAHKNAVLKTSNGFLMYG